MQLTPGSLVEAWVTFKETGDLEARNLLVMNYTGLVRYQAARIGGTLPPMVDRDDLISYGTFGLIDAIDKFDPENGAKFETFAVHRIKGAIYDELRQLDWVPRSVRSKARDVERAKVEAEVLLGRPPTHVEVATYLGLSSQEYGELHRQSNVHKVESYESSREYVGASGEATSFMTDWYTRDHTSDLQEDLEVGEIVGLVSAAIAKMDDRSKVILVLYYIQEMTLAEIGQILGVTESRVCQMQSKVLTSLGESFAAA